MCKRAVCTTCGLATWEGCGEHKSDVLEGVADEERCAGWRTGICLASVTHPAPAADGVSNVEQHEAQQTEIADLQNSLPMIGPVESCSTLVPLYESNPQTGFVEGIAYLSRTFAGMRKIRGDGNCFYRAFLFSYLENILVGLRSGDASRASQTKAELQRLKDVFSSSRADLVAVGYQEFAFETFYDVIMELLDNVEGWSTGGGLEELLSAFQEESGESDYYVWYMRLMTACALKKDAGRFEPFIPDASCASIDEFCARCVEPMKSECEHLQIMALTEYLGVQVHIHMLDGKPCPEGESLVVHKFQEEPGGARICVVQLLYRPGHYDQLIF